MSYKKTVLAIVITASFFLPAAGWQIGEHQPFNIAEAKSTVRPKTPVYVTFFSHNEGGEPWSSMINDEVFYRMYRRDLVEKVNLIHSYGATLNWESDHAVLEAMLKWERGDILKDTKGKNVVRWMVEDMGVVVDPHGHLEEYNYADLAFLISRLGVRPSGVVGGFALYKECSSKSEDIVAQLEMGRDGTIKGKKYPFVSWKPKILAQPAMIGHVFDETSSGVWQPDLNNFLKNDPRGQFITVGQGYSHYTNLIGPKNSGGSTIWYSDGGYVKELVRKIDAGQVPSGRIYTASVHMVDIFSETPLDGVRQILESLKEMKKSGKIVYADYERVARIWEKEYKKTPNRLDFSSFSVYGKYIADGQKVCSGK